MRLIDPKTFRLELDKLDCIDKFGHVILPITKLNIALERSEVDAVPVVFCRDCKHRFMTPNGWHCPYAEWGIEDDDFCSYGDRKGGNK